MKRKPSGAENKRAAKRVAKYVANYRKINTLLLPLKDGIRETDDPQIENESNVDVNVNNVQVNEDKAVSDKGLHEDEESGENSNDNQEKEEEEEESNAICQPILPHEPSDKNFEKISDDIGEWPDYMSIDTVDQLVLKGPAKHLPSSFEFPKDAKNRRFTTAHYRTKKGEDREWLVYSEAKHLIFCFYCKLFCKTARTLKLATTGFGYWQNVGSALNEHDTSNVHETSVSEFIKTKLRIQKGTGVDSQHQKACQKERKKWRGILKRIVEAVKFLASRNLAFRGSTDKLYCQNNGNFLGLLELIAEFDPVLKAHLNNVQNRERMSTHYLSKDIQNEFIKIMADKTLSVILEEIKQSIYFSIILDCTPDVSHTEQMSIVLRYVTIKNKTIEVKESFVGFVVAHGTTGEALTEYILKFLETHGLCIDNVRGQSYDNGSNMKGKYSGVQARITKMNRRAFYVACYAHSLNLVLSDMGDCNVNCTTLFGVLQKLYTFASASVKRWEIFENHLQQLKLKPLCGTRWESRVDCVESLKYEIEHVRDALEEISKSVNFEAKHRYEAKTLVDQIESFPFLVLLCAWFDILHRINMVSKELQERNINVCRALKLLENAKAFLVRSRNTGLASAQIAAKELAEKLELPKEAICFPTKRTQTHTTAEDEFRISTFLPLLDMAIASLDTRFGESRTTLQEFQIFYDVEFRKKLSDSELKSHCQRIQVALSDNEGKHSDVNASRLFDNFKLLKDNDRSAFELPAFDLLKHIVENGNEGEFKTLCVGLRVLLTIPMTVATCERSFSKLKLIKNYLRSTMTEDRLNGLSILSIENEIVKSIKFKDIIEEFARIKTRKVVL